MRVVGMLAAFVAAAAGCSFDGVRPSGAADAGLDVAAVPDAMSAPDAVLAACATQFTDFKAGTSSYLVVTGEANFDSAESDCAAVEGGRLVIIEDAAELQLIESELAQRSIREAWIGLSQSQPAQEPSGGWSWTDGRSHTPAGFGWASGEPNNFLFLEHCAEQVVDRGGTGWNDVSCDKQNPSICECDWSP